MEVVVLTQNRAQEIENSNVDPKDSKIRYLEIKNKQLEKENNFLLSVLAKVIGRKTVIITEEEFYRLCQQEQHFHVDKNLGGDILITNERRI